ncbi:MAG: type II toxin-antitoxin system prevent-host-death family antitoxin [Phycisphaerae bacterium]|nr:type II toxin-antitoxin system prevent-host-death family antitoxin [Phycisphaerae bacterium]
MTVKPGGWVEIVLPELNGGETVEVVVRRRANTVAGTTRPGFGRARGQITIRDDFDDPIEDFGDYM